MNGWVDLMQSVALAGLMFWALRAHPRVFGSKANSSVTDDPTEPRD